MATYPKRIGVGGKWAKAAEIKNGTRAKIISETNPQPSSFSDKDGNPKTQDVCRVQFEGNPEALNVSLNRATINGLVDAFGEDSAAWRNHYLRAETEKMIVGGKAVRALYLIPEGYAKTEDDNGYIIIVKEGEKVESVNPEDLPF
jgi:hypothetical protein